MGDKKTRYLSYREVLLAAAALIMLSGRACPEATGWTSAHRITASDTLFSGQYADGQINDILLENERIAVVIGDTWHELPYALSGGNIIDAGSRGGRIDALMEIYTHFDNFWPRQAIYNFLEIAEDGAGGGPARIYASGLDSRDPYLTVFTEYRLDPGKDYVSISTTVRNTGGRDYEDFEVGDAISWGECDKFAPGYGFALWGDASAPWLAGTAEDVSYGYMAADGADLWGDQGELYSHMNMRLVSLAQGDSVTYERYFIVGGRDIASVATIIHGITGAPVGSLYCRVANEDGDAIEGAEIEAFDTQEKPYIQMETGPLGLAFATLPPGEWHLVAGADDFDSTEAWVSVSENEATDEGLTLEPAAVIRPATGDTLTVIQRPLLNIPAFAIPGSTLVIQCEADPATTGWTADIMRGPACVPLEVSEAVYDTSTLWWKLEAVVPEVPAYGLYDLSVAAEGGVTDTTRHAVQVIPGFKDDYYFVHVTDPHLPTHRFYYESGAENDSSEMVDLREVIADINIINPEFVLLTGDLVNEGELEDFLDRRYYTKGQRMLTEFEVPVFLTAGNHDLGGWSSTPPPDGTARRDWWRFFGWKRLNDPPSGAPWYTQDYSFDYGPVHYVGLEAYDNYDRWRSEIYGRDSFTSGQLEWLAEDLAAAEASGSAAQVLFYHYDFSRQINLTSLGVEMALWGHIHRDAGTTTTKPYNLSTNNVCDGERSYRLVRVSGSDLQPSRTISAGADGRNLRVEFDPPNDGTQYSLTAYVSNGLPERFEHAMLRFRMPAVCDSVEVSGGTLLSIEDLGSSAIYYVGVDLLPAWSGSVSVSVDSCHHGSGGTGGLMLARNRPNPFNPQTTLSFTLPRDGFARLAIYDIRGREVAVLVEEPLAAGPHSEEWDGVTKDNRPAASGIYFATLAFEGETRVQKLVLMR
jgi:hypothetical protein